MSRESGNKAVVVLEFEDPDHDLFFRVVDEIRVVLSQREECTPRLIHVGIRDVAENVLDVFGQDEERNRQMGLVKHGEGEVIPETEQQKTAAQSGEGMSEEAAEALRAENAEADGGSGQG